MAITHQQVFEACQKDPKYQELLDRVKGYHAETAEYKQKQRQAFRKIIQFDKLEDLAMDRMGMCEGNDHDEALLDCTGQDQETWFWSWSGVEDLCFDSMVEAAIAASNAQSMIDVVKDKQAINAALMTSREAEIRAKLESEEQSTNA